MSSAGRAAVVDRLCDFFVSATQTVLYVRAVYPRGTFQPARTIAQHFQQHQFTKAQTTHCRREYTTVALSPFESIISETFEAREQYGVPVYISRSPLLSDYVRDTVSSFREWLLQVSNTIYTI
jgi:hypothetical protein